VTRPGIQAGRVAELIKLATDKPGGLTYASSGPGTPYHMAGELFKSMTGTNILHVPYKGSSGARTDVLGGQVDMMFGAAESRAVRKNAGFEF
jgi:tripartite-type tricarboxylate transporter receptor subunit TctC